jgi:hypothetical protein
MRPCDVPYSYSSIRIVCVLMQVGQHSYELMYGPFLAPLLQRPVHVLEIGVFDGRSLKLWVG